MIDEQVRHDHRSDFQPRIKQTFPGQMLHHLGAEASDRRFFDSDQNLMIARQLLHQRGVDRLGEAGIGDRRGETSRGEFIRRL